MEQHLQCVSPQREKRRSASTKGEMPAQLSLSRKRAEYQKFPVRRSQRVQNTIIPASNLDIEPVFEEIADSGSDKEEERQPRAGENVPIKYVSKEENVHEQNASEEENVFEHNASEEEELAAPTSRGKTLVEKIDHITQLLEAHEKTTETVKLKVLSAIY